MVSIETIMRERDARVNVRNFRYAGFDPASRFSVAWQNPSGTPDQVRGDEDLRGSGLDRLERLHPRRLDTLQLGRELAAALRQVTHRQRSEEHTSELQSLMRISYAVFCLKKKNTTPNIHT